MKISRKDILSMVPVKNESMMVEKTEKGAVVILRRKKKLLIDILAFLFQMPDEKRIELDEIGIKVLQSCDGFNSVSNIVGNLMKEDFRNVKRHDVEDAVFKYLNQLSKRRMVGFK